MKYLFVVLCFLCSSSIACMDCGEEPPVPEREPELLLVESMPDLQVLEVDAVLDTDNQGNPENIRILNKSSALVSNTVIIKSIESVKFITQGGKSTCHVHSKKNIYYKYKFKIE